MKLHNPPAIRQKIRYIVFKVHSDEKIPFFNIKNAIDNSIQDWMGESDTAKARIWIIRNLWDDKKQTGFIRCSSRFVDKVKTALGLVHQIGDSRVVVQTMRVTGTIKSGKDAK